MRVHQVLVDVHGQGKIIERKLNFGQSLITHCWRINVSLTTSFMEFWGEREREIVRPYRDNILLMQSISHLVIVHLHKIYVVELSLSLSAPRPSIKVDQRVLNALC
ncbi:hypothetical protein P153DRAFT_367410 [Dothidotthia symphoricarpi CBS 119687]|uniref:Uncharacterized protein n=1 Tax=Dothidotthia symphoricarpi CBS 119687 TaxID=1392245 RepID=A0A6A6ADW3_9PLEO|nr:uncharacterized protein P153DRAFT_367410 [Dothidotthia symphoricarpi CBS 119687]KAF2129138.1 hypothetical protein P153DRAFT_367410 [Dothidotthia symphoricarpi CBS 119687]